MRIQFSPKAWAEYLWWQKHNRIMLARINALIRHTLSEPHAGMGKPEQLKDNLEGVWLRRIDEKHRFVYRIKGNICEVVQCKGHYEDKQHILK